MIKAFPPRRPRGSWWVALAVALSILPAGAISATAQDSNKSKKGGVPKPQDKEKSDSAPDSAREDAEKKAKAVAAAEKAEAPDRWEDPRAEAALKNNFPSLPPVTLPPADRNLVDQLAKGQPGQLDPEAVKRYVHYYASDLTNKTYLQALMDPAGDTFKAKKIEAATAELLKPLMVPQTASNAAFRRRYVETLVDTFKPLWRGNLHARTMAMIVLSRSGDAQAIPVFVSQLNDPEQLAIVKLLSAVGITNVAQNGRRDLDSKDSILAAKALSDFLVREPDTFWPAQFRALEALGSVRQATDRPRDGKAEFADTALGFLVDSKAAPDVRAWAAWSLGMMDIPQSVKNYNFPLVSHAIGQAAVDIGTRIAAVPDLEKSRLVRSRLANLLVQLNQAFVGDPEIRNSGLLHSKHPSAGPSMTSVMEFEKRVRAVTKASLELSAAVGDNVPKVKKSLIAALDDLRSLLAKPLASGKTLYQGGPSLPDLVPPKVADGVRR